MIMKKINYFGLAIVAVAALAACNKEINVLEEVKQDNNSVVVNEPKIVSLSVTTENTDDEDTKVSISESGSVFYLNWQGTETFTVGNTNRSTSSTFSIGSYSGRNATFSGTLPDAAGSSTTNYIAAFNLNSVEASGNIRATIPVIQDYAAGGVVSTNCLLVAREDGVEVDKLSSLNFKTMNAFLKFTLSKGTAAAGSSNDYSSHMYVRDIVVETIADDEAIAGRFGISKTAADWYTGAYAEEVAGNLSEKVTLNCVTSSFANGVDLADSDQVFYVAIAYKDYSKGLRVIVTVENGAGKYGKFVKTISKNKTYSVARNTIRALPTLTVNPNDADPEITLWSEDWTGGTASDSPSAYMSGTHTGFYKYSGTVTYTQSSASNVKLYAETNAGGTSPELYIKKSATWTISGIPTNGAKTLSLTYKCGNSNSRVTLSGATAATISGSPKAYIITPSTDGTINLVFSASGGNTRVDDIVLKVTNIIED